MKASTINKKWILTASLLTVLCGHYSYQTSSITLSQAHAQAQNSGEYVLASTEDTRPQRPKKPSTSQTEVKTESGTVCTEGCDKPTDAAAIKPEEFIKLVTRLEALEKAQKEYSDTSDQKPAAPVTTTTVKEKESDSDCEPARADETRKEKRDRLKCEKDEKEALKKEEREEKFLDRVEALKDKCGDKLACLTSGFTSILSRFDGKNALSAKIVNEQFRYTVAAPLSIALYSDDPAVFESTLSALQSLIQDMPEQYRGLRQSVMKTVSTKALRASQSVKESFAKMNAAAQANNPQAYFEAKQTAESEYRALGYLNQSYSSSIEQSLAMTEDTSAISYYQKSYVPDMQKIMAVVIGTPATPTTVPGTTTTTRDSRTTTINTSGTSTPSVTTTIPADKMTTDNRWLTPVNNGTVIFDAARPASRNSRSGQPVPQ